MIREDRIRLHLRLLAVYSVLFSLVLCPVLWVAAFGPGDNTEGMAGGWFSFLSQWWQVRGFLIASLFASVLWVIYWFLARAWLNGGAPVWPIHVTYVVAVAPLIFFWFSVLAGPVRNVLAP